MRWPTGAPPKRAESSVDQPSSNATFRRRLDRIYLVYTAGFILFVMGLAALEQMGLSKRSIGVIFLLSTVLLYAGIGILSRTTEPVEYLSLIPNLRCPRIERG